MNENKPLESSGSSSSLPEMTGPIPPLPPPPVPEQTKGADSVAGKLIKSAKDDNPPGESTPKLTTSSANIGPTKDKSNESQLNVQDKVKDVKDVQETVKGDKDTPPPSPGIRRGPLASSSPSLGFRASQLEMPGSSSLKMDEDGKVFVEIHGDTVYGDSMGKDHRRRTESYSSQTSAASSSPKIAPKEEEKEIAPKEKEKKRTSSFVPKFLKGSSSSLKSKDKEKASDKEKAPSLKDSTSSIEAKDKEKEKSPPPSITPSNLKESGTVEKDKEKEKKPVSKHSDRLMTQHHRQPLQGRGRGTSLPPTIQSSSSPSSRPSRSVDTSRPPPYPSSSGPSSRPSSSSVDSSRPAPPSSRPSSNEDPNSLILDTTSLNLDDSSGSFDNKAEKTNFRLPTATGERDEKVLHSYALAALAKLDEFARHDPKLSKKIQNLNTKELTSTQIETFILNRLQAIKARLQENCEAHGVTFNKEDELKLIELGNIISISLARNPSDAQRAMSSEAKINEAFDNLATIYNRYTVHISMQPKVRKNLDVDQ